MDTATVLEIIEMIKTRYEEYDDLYMLDEMFEAP